MVLVADIAPRVKRNVMDLVAEAGLDVSDWANYRGAAPAANPKYCYEWAFAQPGVGVVLNLWHPRCQQDGDDIVQRNNLRADELTYQSRGEHSWARRARGVDEAIRTAMRSKLPIRVILLDGVMRNVEDEEADASSIKKRDLDPEFWSVREYDAKTGQHVLVRGGAATSDFVDQFDLPPPPGGPPTKVAVSGTAFVRDPRVRDWVRRRAAGCCEYCGCLGFRMSGGRIYLETHHIISLSAGGPDTVGNVIALCPNHHREAHHGEDPIAFRDALLAKIMAR